MTAVLDVEDLRPLLLDIIARHPDNSNPRSDFGGCLYTSPQDACSHCLVGQLATEQGWSLGILPTSTTLNAQMMARTYRWPITDTAALYLLAVQGDADALRCGEPTLWRDLVYVVSDTVVVAGT